MAGFGYGGVFTPPKPAKATKATPAGGGQIPGLWGGIPKSWGGGAPAPPAPSFAPPAVTDPTADPSGDAGSGGSGAGISQSQIDYYRNYLQNYLQGLALQRQGLDLSKQSATTNEKTQEQAAGRSATVRGATATQGYRDQLAQLKTALQTQLAQYGLRGQQMDLQQQAEQARIANVTKGAVGG